MTADTEYAQTAPTRAEVETLPGSFVIEFGTSWCGHCQAAQPLIKEAFAGHPGIAHMKIEDGSGRPLGRSFRVKLWPTLIFMRAGQEVTRLVRPTDTDSINQALQQIETV